jgi:ppGpp synthetase/RelA/SpoT-type nucleotidyltranferase
MSEIEKAYQRRYPALCRAKKRLQIILTTTAEAIDDRQLVRAAIVNIRIKQPDSIKAKAKQRRWKYDDAITNCPDLIGARVVCNNVEDVYRFAELLKTHFSWEWFEIQDHIKNQTNPPDIEHYM